MSSNLRKLDTEAVYERDFSGIVNAFSGQASQWPPRDPSVARCADEGVAVGGRGRCCPWRPVWKILHPLKGRVRLWGLLDHHAEGGSSGDEVLRWEERRGGTGEVHV